MEIQGFRKCDGCFTAKVVMGLGMVEMKCPNCNGVGYLEKVDDEIAYLEKLGNTIESPAESENVVELTKKYNSPKAKNEKMKRE